jgi:hypothetical protein
LSIMKTFIESTLSDCCLMSSDNCLAISWREQLLFDR